MTDTRETTTHGATAETATPALALPDPWANMTIPALVKGAAMLWPERVLIADGAGSATVAGRPDRTLTSAGLLSEANRLASVLIELGLAAGENVLVLMPSVTETWAATAGILMAGGIPAMLPPFASIDEARAAAALVKPGAIVTMTRFAGLQLAETARHIAVAQESVRFIAAFGERPPAGVAAIDTMLRRPDHPAPALRAPRIDNSQTALITFDTTTGSVRALARSHAQIIAEALHVAATAQIAADSRVLMTLSPATVVGAAISLAVPLLTGATIELSALFDGCAFAGRLGKGRGLSVVLPASAEAAYAAHAASRRVRTETIVLLHRPKPQGMGRHPTSLVGDRAVDMLWLGEACGGSVRRPAAKSAREIVLRMPSRDGLALETDADGLHFVSGPLAPVPVAGEAQRVATGFRAVASEVDEAKGADAA